MLSGPGLRVRPTRAGSGQASEGAESNEAGERPPGGSTVDVPQREEYSSANAVRTQPDASRVRADGRDLRVSLDVAIGQRAPSEGLVLDTLETEVTECSPAEQSLFSGGGRAT